MSATNRLPRGFREDTHTGQLACPHRDVSVCVVCAKVVGVVEVYAQHFWVPDPAERAQLEKEIRGGSLGERPRSP